MPSCVRILVLYALTLLSGLQAEAQSYGASVGLRLGNNPSSRSIGLTAQYRVAKTVTLEGILQSDFRNNTTVHLLMERHRRILSRRLNFYVGAGFSVGNELSKYKDPNTKQEVTTYDNPTIGTDLIFGAETTMLGYNIALDYKPNINFIGREPWYISQVGISVRQVVIKSGAQKKRVRQRERAKRKKDREKDKDEEPWFHEWYEKTFKKK